MSIDVPSLSLKLRANQCVRLDDASGMALHVKAGAVWITQEGDAADHVVQAGRSFVIERGGLTLVSALSEAEFRLDPPAGRAWRRIDSTVIAALMEEARRARSQAIFEACSALLRLPLALWSAAMRWIPTCVRARKRA